MICPTTCVTAPSTTRGRRRPRPGTRPARSAPPRPGGWTPMWSVSRPRAGRSSCWPRGTGRPRSPRPVPSTAGSTSARSVARPPGWPRTASATSRCWSTPSSAWRRSGRSRSRTSPPSSWSTTRATTSSPRPRGPRAPYLCRSERARRRTVRPMRRTAAVLALAVPVALALVAAPAPAATTGPPSFVTTLLDGSSGSSEPRATVAPKDLRYIVTNAKNGDETVYRSPDGKAWTKLTTPPGQTSPTTDVDIVSMPNGRILTSELDFAGINFITAYSDDQGKTWTQSQGTTYADTDRQWFAVGP